MVIPYYEELESRLIRYELANLSEENKKRGVSSTILSAKPAFILPNNNLYYTTTNHYGANFYRDVIHCFEVIETSKIKEKVEVYKYNEFRGLSINDNAPKTRFDIYNNEILIDDMNYYKLDKKTYDLICKFLGRKLTYKEYTEKEIFNGNPNFAIYMTEKRKDIQTVVINYDAKERIETLKDRLIKTRNDITNNGLLAADVRDYLNFNCIPFDKYHPYLENLYNDDCKRIVLSIIESKLQVYYYFLKLLGEGNYGVQLLDPLLQYPNKLIKKKEEKEVSNYGLPNIDFDGKLEGLKNRSFIQDFAVQTMDFDKVESQLKKTITTSKININEAFFNYLIMDFDVINLPKIIYHENENSFIQMKHNDFITTSKEKEFEEEVKLIKKYIPYNERRKYFK